LIYSPRCDGGNGPSRRQERSLRRCIGTSRKHGQEPVVVIWLNERTCAIDPEPT